MMDQHLHLKNPAFVNVNKRRQGDMSFSTNHYRDMLGTVKNVCIHLWYGRDGATGQR